MNNQLKFQIALDKVSEVTPLLVGEAQKEYQEKSEIFLNEIQDTQYIKVPLVGVFSAGKSSLLNVFTERPGMLPVDTLPETAVAYELYYAAVETVELYRDGLKVDTKPLSDIKSLDTKPGDIAKVYCDSLPVKELQERGIILVDMPGIGSGIERHDSAIFNYIHAGTAFVLVVDADQGALRTSTLSFMHELSQYNMFPAVLISKIDKKTEKAVNDMVEYIRYQMVQLGNIDPYISTVCSVNNDLSGLKQYLYSLDADGLMFEKYNKKFKQIVGSVMEQLKVRVELRSKVIENADEKIQVIDKEIANVKAEMPNDRNADTPEKSTQDILDNVHNALLAKSEEIARMIMDKENQEEIKSVIVSTVRTTIISSLQEESAQYSEALGAAVQESIQDLSSIEVNTDVLSDFSDIIDTVKGYVDALLDFGGIFGLIIKQVLPFLPDVINWLFGKDDVVVLEETREKFMNQCAKQIVDNIKPTIFKITVDNQRKIQENLQAEMIAKMEKIKEGLREKIADATKTKEEVAAEIAQLNDGIERLNAIVASI